MVSEARLILLAGTTGYAGGRLLKALETGGIVRAATRQETKPRVAA